jgi:hypothetical protein
MNACHLRHRHISGHISNVFAHFAEGGKLIGVVEQFTVAGAYVLPAHII